MVNRTWARQIINKFVVAVILYECMCVCRIYYCYYYYESNDNGNDKHIRVSDTPKQNKTKHEMKKRFSVLDKPNDRQYASEKNNDSNCLNTTKYLNV